MHRFWLRLILWISILPLLIVTLLLIRCVLDYLLRPEKVDYFGKFEAMVHDQYEPLEDNGFRDLVQTLGPHAFGELSLARDVAWQDMPTDNQGGQWWKNMWIPHCEAFQIDPHVQPRFLGYRPFDEFITMAGITGHEPPLSIRQAVCYAQAVAEYVDQMALAEARADETEAAADGAEKAEENRAGNEEWNGTEYGERWEEIWKKEILDESDWDFLWSNDESACYRGSYGLIYEDWRGFIGHRYPLCFASPICQFQTPDVRYPELSLPKLTDDETIHYFSRLRQESWTAAQNPQAAQWVIETSPVFDTLGVAARKPHYLPYYAPRPLLCMQCPDLYSTINLTSQLKIRCCYRIGNGDIDGAIYDTMTLFHLARHLQQQPISVGFLVGVKIEGMANDMLRLIVHFGTPNSVQLATCQSQLEALPPTPNPRRMLLWEEYMALDCAQEVYFYPWERSAEREPETATWFVFGGEPAIETFFNLFRPDLNTVCEIIHQRYAELQEIACDTDIPRKNQRLNEFYERLEIVHPKGWQVIPYIFSLAISKQHRSEWMGNGVACILIPPFWDWTCKINTARSRTDISRIGLAIERFRLARLDEQTEMSQTSSNTNPNDATESTSTESPPTESLAAQPSESSSAESSSTESLLPKTLDELVDAGFLDTLPKDPFTQKNYVYQPRKYIPWQQEFEKTPEGKGLILPINLVPTEYLLYGVGPNGIDDTVKWNASHGQIPPDMKLPGLGEGACDDLRF